MCRSANWTILLGACVLSIVLHSTCALDTGSQPRSDVQRNVAVTISPAFRGIVLLAGLQSQQVPVTLSEPSDVTLTFRGHHSSKLPGNDLVFSPTDLAFQRDGPSTLYFTVTAMAPGQYTVSYVISGADAADIKWPLQASIIRVKPREIFAMRPRLDVAYVGRLSREYAVSLSKPSNVMLVPSAAGISFIPETLVFQRSLSPSATFQLVASEDAAEAGNVTVTYTVECFDEQCDAINFVTPPPQHLVVKKRIELHVPAQLQTRIGVITPISVSLSSPFDVVVGIHAPKLQLNNTFVRFTQHDDISYVVGATVHEYHADSCRNETSACAFEVEFVVSGMDREVFEQRRFTTILTIAPVTRFEVPPLDTILFVNTTAPMRVTRSTLPTQLQSEKERNELEQDARVIVNMTCSSSNITIEPAHVLFGPHDYEKFFNVTAAAVGEYKLNFALSGSAAPQFDIMEELKATAHLPLFSDSFDFEELGVGGLDEELRSIARRAFLSHVLPASVVENIGITHVRGILLYGPPGCGKTTMARQIGKMLNTHPPKIINGPEIMSKYLGESETKMRELFAEAEADEKAGSAGSGKVHLIIFDEIDSLMKPRGRGRGEAADQVYDGVANTLLSKMDGMQKLNNILVIGTTNRKELLDSALLRPGRFDVQVKVALPDFRGRLQILRIHTRHMLRHGHLAANVDLDMLANKTESYTGAELESLVKGATSFAVKRVMENMSVGFLSQMIEVAMDDFLQALEEIEPANRNLSDQLSALLRGGIVQYGQQFSKLVATLQRMVIRAQGSAEGSTWPRTAFSLLLYGQPGSGKSAVAAYLAQESQWDFTKVISAEDLLDSKGDARTDMLQEAFADAYKGKKSFLLLDDLDGIIEHVHNSGGSTAWNNAMLSTLRLLLKRQPPSGCRLLVVGTASTAVHTHLAQLSEAFDAAVEVPQVDKRDDIRTILQSTHAFTSPQELDSSLDHIDRGISIRMLITAVELARSAKNASAMALDFREQLKHVGYYDRTGLAPVAHGPGGNATYQYNPGHWW